MITKDVNTIIEEQLEWINRQEAKEANKAPYDQAWLDGYRCAVKAIELALILRLRR